MSKDESFNERFNGITRLYGVEGAEKIRNAHICVVGIGGVGSWAAEALARTGVGEITLIDHDSISLSNINRQLHTLDATVGREKVAVMVERIGEINPDCVIHGIEDRLTSDNLSQLLHSGLSGVIDAIDVIKYKAEMIYYCKRNKIPMVTTGGAGGMRDPSQITIADLSRTTNDPLAAKVRNQLRRLHNFSRNPKRKFGIECVYSTEQPVYPKSDGSVSGEKPGVHGLSLDCAMGYGASVAVTASFGLMAVSTLLNRLVK